MGKTYTRNVHALQQNCHQLDGSFFPLFSRYAIIMSSSSFDSIVAIYVNAFIFFHLTQIRLLLSTVLWRI